jgi:tyrosyl-tRNA synthetase
MKIITDEKVIDELLSRSVAQIMPSKDGLKKLLMSGKQLKIYIGADCTGPALHLGHATNFIVLERLRKLGHKVFVLFGDFTARIGDPSDKTAARVQLTEEQVQQNVADWKAQISSIINFTDKENPAEIVFNSKWLGQMNFADVLELASMFTVQQMLERDMFKKRLDEDKPIYMHELFYPLMQGYDSSVLDVDIELCGTDQLFNAMTGREIMKRKNNKEKFVLTTTLLENPKTGEKMMSKSLGTGVYLNETAQNMFGRIMSQPDENIGQLFIDCTYLPLDEINQIKKSLHDPKTNPRDVKLRLAYEIVRIYRGDDAARQAQEEFHRIFSSQENPEDMPTFDSHGKSLDLVETLTTTGIVKSKSEVRRLVEQKGIKLNGEAVEKFEAQLKAGDIVKIGKLKWLKIV